MPLPDAPVATPPQATAATPLPAMGFQDVYDAHQKFLSQNPDLSHVSLHDFSQIANEATGSNAFDQGLNDNIVRRAVAAKNDFIKPVTDITGSIGEALGGLVGAPEAGRQAGVGIPETLASLGVVAAPTVIDPFGGEAVSAALAPAVFGGDAALNTYGSTGSLPATAVAGTAGALLPKSGEIGASIAGNLVNNYTARTAVGDLLPQISPTVARLADFVGANTGIVTNQQAADVAQAGAVNGLPGALDAAKHVFTMDNAVSQAVGLAPFAAHEAFSQSRFGKPQDPNSYAGTAQVNRDQENAQRLEALSSAVKDRFLTTATTNSDIVAASDMHAPLTPEQVEANLKLNPSGKSAADSAATIKLGLNDVTSRREGGAVKSAAASAETFAGKYEAQEAFTAPENTLFQQPIEKPASESAQAMEDAWTQQKQVSESTARAQNLRGDLQEQENNLDQGIKGQNWPGEFIQPQPKEGDTDGGKGTRQEGASAASTDKAGSGEVSGSQPDRGNAEEQRQDVGENQGQLGDDLDGQIRGQPWPEPLHLTPEVIEMSHIPPETAEDAQKMMETGNGVSKEASEMQVQDIRKGIQVKHDFDNDEMQPFTDKWIMDHYSHNNDLGMTDEENYKDIVGKAQAHFRDTVNSANQAILEHNDAQIAKREEANKQIQKGKDTFKQRVEDLTQTLATLPKEEATQASKDIEAVLKEKGRGQQTQGEANVYEAASVELKKKKEDRKSNFRGVLARAYDMGTKEEMRSNSSDTGETEVNEKGETVKVKKLPLSINAPVGEEGHREYGDTLQDMHSTNLPESEWLDKEARRMQNDNPTGVDTQKALMLKHINEVLKYLKGGGGQRVLDAAKATALDPANRKLGVSANPRNPEVFIQNLLLAMKADMMHLEDKTLVGHWLGTNGDPISEETIHGARSAARAVIKELLKQESPELKQSLSAKNTSEKDVVKALSNVNLKHKDVETSGFTSNKDGNSSMREGTKESFAQTTKEFMSLYAKKLGLEGDERKIFVETATRIATVMASSDRTRLSGLKGSKHTYGTMTEVERTGQDKDGNPYPYTSLVSLLSDPKVLAETIKVTDKDYNKFMQLYALGHEASHVFAEMALTGHDDPDYENPKFAAQNTAYMKLHKMALTMNTQEKGFMIKDMMQMIVPRQYWKNDPQIQKAIDSITNYASGDKTGKEFLATLNGLIHFGMAQSSVIEGGAKTFSDYLTFSSAAVVDFSRGVYMNLVKYSEALQSYWKSHDGSEFGIDTNKLADVMSEATTFMKQYGRIPEEISKFTDRLTQMKLNYPGQYLTTLQDNKVPFVLDSARALLEGANGQQFKIGLGEAGRTVGASEKTPEELFKRSAGMWNLMTAGHWAQKFPAMADVIDLAHSYTAIANEYTSKALAPLLVKFGKDGKLMRDTSASGIREVNNNPKALNALNETFRWQNENGSQLAPKDVTDKLFADVDPRLAKQALFYRDQMSKSMVDIATRHVASKQADMVKAGALLLLKENPSLSHDAYMMQAQDLVDAKLQMANPDPQVQLQAGAKLAQVMQNATPGMLAASRMTDALMPEFQKFSEQMLNKPGYTPESRQGPYMVKWGEMQEDGTVKPFTLGFKTKQEATSKYNQVHSTGRALDLSAYDRTVKGAAAEGLNSKIVEAFSQFDNAAFKAAMQYAPEAAKEIQQYFQSGEGLLKEIQSRGYRKNLMQRSLAGGREELNILQECFNYIQSSSNGMAKNETRGQLMLRSNEAQVLAEPNLRQDALQHVENTINPPVAEFNKLKEGIFQYFLGGNLSSLLVDASHPVLSLAPFLVEKGAGLVGAYKNIAYAGAKVASAFGKGSLQKATTFEDFQKLVGDKDLAQGLFRAKQDGLLQHGILNEFRVADDMDLLNLKAVSTDKGSVFNSTADLLKNSAYQYLRLTRQLFSWQSHNNNLFSYIASFKTARDQGNSVEQAHDFASRTVNTVLPQGGRGSRPIVFSKLGKAQSIAGVMYSLQSYTTSLLSMHARLAADSLGQSGLSGVQLSNARKALAIAVVSQVGLAGVLGLPFVGATLALLQNVFPELKASETLRGAFHSLGGDDKAMGDAIADSALKGLPAMLTGVDLSGRLGLQNILGTNPYNGFDAGALVGPTGSLVQKMVLGMGSLAQGNLQEASENLLPTAYKNLLDAYVFDKVGRDKEGNLLTQPTDASRFLSAVGIKTTAETNARDQQAMLSQSQRANALELKQFYGKVADQIAVGNMDEARQLLYARSQQDPSFSAQAGVKQAVATLQARQAPRDMLARVGLTNSEDAQRIAALFPAQSMTDSHQTQDLLQKTQLERQVGVPGVGVPAQASMREAQAIDYLVDSYKITPAQARAMLSHAQDAKAKLGQRQAAWMTGSVVPSQ